MFKTFKYLLEKDHFYLIETVVPYQQQLVHSVL